MAEHIRKTDRRTERTRQLLREALMELIVEKKGYDAVSIHDITDRADVARTTFYLHFRDKDELLLTGMAEMYDQLLSGYHLIKPEELADCATADEKIDSSDYQHVERYADFYRIMLTDKGSLTFLLGVLQYLENSMSSKILDEVVTDKHSPRIPLGLIANMIAWMEAGAMDWWLRKGGEYSPDDMALFQHQMCMFGLSWALRLNVEPSDVTPP